MAETGRRRQAGHFTEEDWVDFACQQAGAEQRARLERHLRTGCERCAETLEVWTAVRGLAGQEASYRPPDDIIAQVRGQFALHRPKGLLARVATSASLVFDSFRQPVPVGIRAAGGSARQLLFKAGRYAIRLQVEPVADSDRLSVVGQMVDETNPKNPLPDLPVLLLSGQETVDRTLTNTLGEFQLESVPSGSVRLSVGVPEIGTLTLPGRLVGRRARRGAGTWATLDGSGRRTKARHP